MFHARHPRPTPFSPCSIAILTVVTGGLAANAGATILNVPADFATIQAAINAAVNGDEVLIAPGTYVASQLGLTLTNKAITLRGSGGAAVTIIQAFAPSSQILVMLQVEADTVLDGLTFNSGGSFLDAGVVGISGHPTLMNCVFQNATASAIERSGAGNMLVSNCQFLNNIIIKANGAAMELNGSVTITGCTFTGNVAKSEGGAIRLAGGGTISGCTFEMNSVVPNTGNQIGGAIYVTDSGTDLLIEDCTFNSNSSPGKGGAIYADRSSVVGTVTISSCQFTGNSATTTGGAVYGKAAPVSVVDCTFTGNSATTGGGAHLINGASATGCTFTNNLTVGGGDGAGLAVENTTATNCMFTGNQATGKGGAMHVLGTTATLTNCNAFGNSAGVGVGGGLHSAPGTTVALVDYVLCANTPNNFEVGGLLNASNVIACDQPLGPVGACCLPQGGCVVTSETNCLAAKGTYQGNATTCEKAGCPDPEPSCVSDIAPPGGDDAVNVSDLLKVISDWGACP
ncbi:MAG: right-handed parallel beta-helix repeat-containing protein [Phycisphaerales bacterium]|nr:right-handed parallel beta-helix repeat-containing protein [Phycisphaerales bacterium]